MNDDEIKLIASRRSSPVSPERLVLPANLEDLMRNAEQWSVNYASIQGLLDYAAVDIETWPKFTRGVVLHVTNFPHEDACNVVCMFRTIDIDELWLKWQAPQVCNTQYVGMAHSESKQMWHTAVLGIGTGAGRELVYKPGASLTVGTVIDGCAMPAANEIDVEALHHSMGTHFWLALSTLESRGLAMRTERNGEHHFGVFSHAASTARN